MSVKAHYDNHLGSFYSWMVGDFAAKQKEHQDFLELNGIRPQGSGVALDLGAGHGIQSVSLAKIGFNVTAIDFNRTLLTELEANRGDLPVTCVEGDITELKKYAKPDPELVICWGDTLTHLDDQDAITKLIQDCAELLSVGGMLILSFRDYSQALDGNARFIPVKSDDSKILTCFLEYFPKHVAVSDILQTKTKDGWVQKVSSYQKVRIAPDEVMAMLTTGNFSIQLNETTNRTVIIIASKSR